jgi:hypothetical protein
MGEIEGAPTGPFPAKAGPTHTARCISETGDAQRHGMHSHAERGNDQDQRLPG